MPPRPSRIAYSKPCRSARLLRAPPLSASFRHLQELVFRLEEQSPGQSLVTIKKADPPAGQPFEPHVDPWHSSLLLLLVQLSWNPAEDAVVQLIGKIDRFVDCRSGRDHTHIDLFLPGQTHSRNQTGSEIDQGTIRLGQVSVGIEHHLIVANKRRSSCAELRGDPKCRRPRAGSRKVGSFAAHSPGWRCCRLALTVAELHLRRRQ